jgi:ribonuclease HI
MNERFIDKLSIFIDGASRGNPGHGAIGFVIYDQNGNILREYAECIGNCTNNVAEYKALIKALEFGSTHSRGEVICFMDSELVVKQMNGSFRLKKTHLKELFQEVKLKESMYKKVTYQNLPREHPKIVRVDKIVNKALDQLNEK